MATNSQVSEPQRAAADAPVVLDIDPDHSQAEFSVKHLMITKVRGRFAGPKGSIRWDPHDPSNSHVRAEIDVATVDTGVGDRDDHLRSGDFFDADNHPRLTFESKRVEPKGGDKARIVGDLTIRGTTREVVLDASIVGRATDPWGNERVGFEGSTTIDRTDFGLEWNQALEAGGWLVGDKVKITIQVSSVERSDDASANGDGGGDEGAA